MKKFLKMKSLYLILLLTSIAILIYFCVDDNNLLTLLENISILNLAWVFLACGLMFLSWIIDACVIKMLTSSAYDKNYRLKEAFKVTMVGQFFNAVTPLGVAGQPMQVLTITQQNIDTGHAVSIIVRKFIIYQTTLIFYLLGTMLVSYAFFIEEIPDFMTLVILGCVSQSMMILLIAFFTTKKKLTMCIISWTLNILAKLKLVKSPEIKIKDIEKQMNIYVENNRAIGENPKLTLKTLCLTCVQLTALFSVSFCVYKAFNNPGFDLIDMISGQAFVTVTGAYIPLPGGSGAMESAFIKVFNLFFPKENIKPAMLLWRFVTYYLCIIVSMLFSVSIKKKKTKEKKVPFSV